MVVVVVVDVCVVVCKGWQWWVVTQATCTVWWCFLGGGVYLVLVVYVC